MGGFNKLTDLAQQLAGKDQSNKDQQQQQQQQQDPSIPQTTTTTTTNDQEWAEVGSAAKKAFAGFQADQAGGKGPDYTEIGDIAQRAFTAYNHGGGGEEGKKDLAEIGKGIAAGFGAGGGGGGEKTKEEGKLGGTAGKLEDEEETAGGESEGQDGETQTDAQGDDGLAVSKSNAGVTTGLASKTLSGGNLDFSTEKQGLNSQTKREAGAGTDLEKGGLGEDEGVFIGDEERRTDVTRSGETTTSGQGLDRSGEQPVGGIGNEKETLGNQPVKGWIE
ncbi:hypothetical protein HER10_EVM0004170 [Colletotrichum scovillei]|uniref:Uncharacterized protein n=1 Tax=Colletotrichum scovillei TaxID=1209932 RepID=A0A9P7R5J4_9PEZI|nr:uncharacterized protein HER10_EVM0004170 [Colletotrichum scovillei]KAF4781853.1 hypothetical protein HER10_EVM0004170 [Colletotrichum scovillei]KAG7050596.1 hypothetical protein JMJ77_0013339 [Colletotrichum scovillei]KAG7069640.1 hypothetical protein JMJ76_0003303 [Colletotrichum scovillei]KAG7073540.1 hypothetical protein JMJ78_0014513 [Colletotrichum scovillei]